jgi:periplasmic protein TonB
MTTPFNSENRFNEIIFEDRNKEYGAYALRKSYNNTVTRSMLISLSSVTLLVFAVFWFGKGVERMPDLGNNILPPIPVVTVIDLTPVKDHPREKIHPKDPLPPKTDNGRVTASDDPNNTIDKSNIDLTISKVTNDKDADSVNADLGEPKKAEPPVENNDPKPWVSQMPEFEGNLTKFIIDNLKYPEVAKENGTHGLVGLSFIIEKDGSVGEVKVLRGIPDGCTQEAIRVIKMMPKWKPGMDNGIPRRVVLNLPINFSLK